MIEPVVEKWNKERKERGKNPEQWPTVAYRMGMSRGIEKIIANPQRGFY